MYKSLLLSAVVCLFVFSSVLTEETKNFDPFPNCTVQMRTNATKEKLDKCQLENYNASDPAAGCEYWKWASCQKSVIFDIPECKPAGFIFELQYDLVKPKNSSPPTTCTNVTTNAVIFTISENVFHPMFQLLNNKTFENCSRHIKEQMANCLVPFQGLMDGTPSEKDICCDQWNFMTCAQGVTEKEATCSEAKTEFESAYKTMGDNLAKKCPANKFSCKNGATNISLAASLFTLSLIVAIFGRSSL